LIKNSYLGVFRASALKVVADPSFGGSAVNTLKTLKFSISLKPTRIPILFPTRFQFRFMLA